MTVTDAHGLEEAGQHGGGGTGLPDPMHQFEIKRLVELDVFGVDASFTNSGLFMVIAAVLITLFTLIAMRRRALVPGRLQSVAEVSYEFVANMVRDNLTQLVWTRSSNVLGCETNWSGAISFCNDLTYGGQSDWRLPNVRELSKPTQVEVT